MTGMLKHDHAKSMIILRACPSWAEQWSMTGMAKSMIMLGSMIMPP